jgi:hypothetical protein
MPVGAAGLVVAVARLAPAVGVATAVDIAPGWISISICSDRQPDASTSTPQSTPTRTGLATVFASMEAECARQM